MLLRYCVMLTPEVQINSSSCDWLKGRRMQLLESSNMLLLHLGKTGSCYRGTVYYTVLVNLAHHLTGADRHKVMLKNLESASSSSKKKPRV